MKHFNLFLGSLITLFSLAFTGAIQGQDFTRNDSLNLFYVPNNGGSPFFGYNDLDISGDYAIWQSSGFYGIIDVKIERYSSNTKSWNTIRNFSYSLPCYGPMSRGPEVALSDSLGVYSILTLQPDVDCFEDGPSWSNLQLLERNTDGEWIKGQLIRPYDLPDSIKTRIKFDRSDDFSQERSFGTALDVSDNTLAVSTITKNESVGLVLIYEKTGDEWEVKQVLSHPQPFSENENIRDFGKNLKFLENGELYIQSGEEHYVFERMEESWELKDTYNLNSEEGYVSCVVNEDYVIRWKQEDLTLSIFDRDSPDTPTQTFPNMFFTQSIKLLDWVSERHMVSYQTQTTQTGSFFLKNLAFLSLGEDGWEKVDSVTPSLMSQVNPSGFSDFSDFRRLYVTDKQLVLTDVNTYSARDAVWFDISTACRPARSVEFSLSSDQQNLMFRWLGDSNQQTNRIEIANSSGELVPSVPELITGLGDQQYSIPLELLEPDTFTARIKSYCNANPFQKSSFSEPLEYVLEGLCLKPTEVKIQYSSIIGELDDGELNATWIPPAGAGQCEFQWRSTLVPDETTSVLLSGDTFDQYNLDELILSDNLEYRVRCDCNVTEEIELAAFSDWQPVEYPECPGQDQEMIINSQEQLDFLADFFPNCTSFDNEVRINGANATNPIVDFSGFPLQEIGNKFLIENCNNLIDLTGLEGLTETWGLSIVNNQSLNDLSPLGGLEKVIGDFKIKDTPIDWSTDPFTSLIQVVDVDLNNAGSGTFHGLSQVERFVCGPGNSFDNGVFRVRNCDFDSIYFYANWINPQSDWLSIDISNNPNLKWIEPGPLMRRMEELNIVNNGIENLGGLNNIRKMANDDPGFYIINNDQLVSLSGLRQDFSIQSSSTPIEITGNDLLTECAIEPLCGILETHNEGSVTIAENGPLCSDYDEVVDLCATENLISENTQPETEFEVNLFPNPANESLTILTTSEGFTYRMYDLMGRLVTSGNSASSALELPTASFAEGVYLLRIETVQGDTKMERVVIKH
ncbi:MAG: hypothetical protein ACI83L_002945 [Cryomorphaceae bacterium]|jgi:hypothetical protein